MDNKTEAMIHEVLYGPEGAVGGLEGLTVALGGKKNQLPGLPAPIGASIEEAGEEIATALREGLHEIAEAIRSLKSS